MRASVLCQAGPTSKCRQRTAVSSPRARPAYDQMHRREMVVPAPASGWGVQQPRSDAGCGTHLRLGPWPCRPADQLAPTRAEPHQEAHVWGRASSHAQYRSQRGLTRPGCAQATIERTRAKRTGPPLSCSPRLSPVECCELWGCGSERGWRRGVPPSPIRSGTRCNGLGQVRLTPVCAADSDDVGDC